MTSVRHAENYKDYLVVIAFDNEPLDPAKEFEMFGKIS